MTFDSPASSSAVRPITVVIILSIAALLVFIGLSIGVFLWKNKHSGSNNHSSVLSIGKNKKNAIGVIEIQGVILDSKKTLKQIQQFEKSKDIQALLVRINSPGGAVAPSQEIYEALKASKKPVYASMGSVAASGGFYIAMGAQKVYANAGTLTGSIGVIMQFANLSKLYEWAKIKRYALTTGKYKDAGAEYKDMDADEKRILQSMIDDVLEQFRAAVQSARHLSREQIVAVSDGRIFSGNQAHKLKLVDVVGTQDQAIKDLAEAAKIEGEPTLVFPPKARHKWLDLLPTSFDDEDEESHSSTGAPSAKGVLGLFERLLRQEIGASSAPSLSPGVYWLWQP